MMCVRKKSSIKEFCGTSLMHPAATRSIRTGSIERPANIAAKDILIQYGELIELRRSKVAETCKNGQMPDMRTGWLLWQLDLDEFLYYEEEMLAPDYRNYYAEWNVRPARGARKSTKNLWIYEIATGKKKYSVTTEAGAKIQPYFDVPPPTDKNLCYFKVQGEEVEGKNIRVWITQATALCLKAVLHTLDGARISEEAEKLPLAITAREGTVPTETLDQALPILISKIAYRNLRLRFKGKSDEHMMQQFAQYLYTSHK